MIDALKKDLKPVRPLRPAWQYALAALCFGLAVALAWFSRMDVQGWEALSPTAWYLIAPGLALALGASAWSAAQWLSPLGSASLLRCALGLAVAFFGLFLASGSGEFRWDLTATCFSAGSSLSLPVLAFCALLFRRGAPQRRERVAVAAGLFSGLLGFLLIQLHCPIHDLGHLLLGHGALPLAWGLASYLLVKLFSRA